MESIGSKFFKTCLFILQRRRFWSTGGDKFDKEIQKKQEHANQDIPARMYKIFDVESNSLNNCRYYAIHSKKKKSKQVVLYLHGGGYVVPISSFHWRFIAYLVKHTNCSVIVPLYPLAPKNTWRETFGFLMPLYQKLIDRLGDGKNLTIIGDSAGGGLALSLALCIKEQKWTLPNLVIAISPWLDISLKNPEIYKLMNRDLMLGDKGAKKAAAYYASGVDMNHYIVSPLYGNYENMCKMVIFIGTQDMLYPDCERLKNKFIENNYPLDYYVYPKMMHVFPLFYFYEAYKAKKEICDYLLKK